MIIKMRVCALASGSSGNCFYVENDKSAFLIDAGISSKKIVERLNSIGKNPEKISGIFVTHEHSDHIRGVDVFARKFNIPIFSNRKTAESSFLCSNPDLINFIKTEEALDFSGMRIESFLKSHKAAEPVFFSLKEKNKKLSIITDAGFASQEVIDNISDSDFLCLESNHDVEMLIDGPYPWHLKNWIKSDLGHLSNMQAGLSVLEHSRNKLKSVILSHLSQTNNTPEIAFNTFSGLIKERKDLTPKIFVSTREQATNLFEV